MTQSPPIQRPLGRWGSMFAAIWLFFLLDPVRAALDVIGTLRGQVGLVATVGFAVAYLTMWIQLRRQRTRLTTRPPRGIAIAWLCALFALAACMIASLGEVGTACVVYIAVSSVMLCSPRVFVPLVIALAVAVGVAGETVPGWESLLGLAFSTLAASIAVFGIRTMINRNVELLKAQEINASLAVDNERNRFARDLHDILGHSLTVITVKAELANRLFDADPERARAELVDLERLSRDALTDVRDAVTGYRTPTLSGELARARAALAAAGIEGVVPSAAEDVPSHLRELFAWAIREGVTNVIRHSGAQRCTIELTPTWVQVHDDGPGSAAQPVQDGHGITGLRERAVALDASVTTVSAAGFTLRVVARS